MSKPLSLFYDLIMPELPGCMATMVDLHLVRTARDFCIRSRAWRGDFDPISSIAQQATYDIDAPEAQSELVAIHKLQVNDALLWNELARDDDDDHPKYFEAKPFSLSDDLLEITIADIEIPTSSVAGGITGRCSMKPKVTATTLPDFLWLVQGDAMRAGTLAALMLMNGRPWSAAAQGAMYRGEFERHVQHAATNAQLGNTRGPLRTRKWGNTSRTWGLTR